MSMIPSIKILTNSSLLFDVSHYSEPHILATQKKLWALAQHCKNSNEFIDLVPAMNSLTLYLKSSEMLHKWHNSLAKLWKEVDDYPFESQHHKINTYYQGEDLDYVANYHQLTIDEVINLHSKELYHVLFLGFVPGFPYLHGLNSQLFTPRRDNPRVSVPKGAIAIGADQTGIYPEDSPGGWHIIAHTDACLFDAKAANPCLFKPGDTIEFVPVKGVNND
ncbi:5-oxoprolinase subunit PxpB [Pseudoalteromonas sp. SIMBA_153]